MKLVLQEKSIPGADQMLSLVSLWAMLQKGYK
jgi:hypothetical protein